MATIDDLVTTVTTMTSVQQALLEAVNVQKSFIDNAVTASGGSSTAAAASAAAAALSQTDALASKVASAASAVAAAASQTDALISRNASATNAASAATNQTTSLASKVAAEAAAAAAAVSATNAASNSNAVLWVSGTIYAKDFLVYSPITQLPYRRKTNGDGVIDPSVDTANWGASVLSIQTGAPGIRPSLLFDFSNSKIVSNRIQVSRNSVAPYWDSSGLMKNAPVNTGRINHHPKTGECLGLLIEEGRTNKCLYSNDFNNAAWEKTGATSGAVAMAPDGTISAVRLVEDNTAANSHYFSQMINFTSGVHAVFSIMVKAAGRSSVELRVSGAAFSVDQAFAFNLLTGTSSLQSGSAVPYMKELSKGWWECGLIITPTATDSASVRVYLSNGVTKTYDGDSISGLYLFEAQCEDGLFATSRIRTLAAAAARPAEQISMPLSTTWYNQEEGTFVVKAASFARTDIDNSAVGVSDGTTSNFMALIGNISSTNKISGRIVVSGVSQAPTFGTPTGSYFQDGVFYNAGMAYKQNDCAFASDLGPTFIAINAAEIPTVNVLNIGGYYTPGNRALNGHLKSLRYYPKRLSNLELQNLVA